MNSFFLDIMQLPLFHNIERERLALCFSKIQYHTKHYGEGTPLILQGMPYKALYIMIQGTCIGEMSDDSGRVLKIEDFNSPYVLASALLFADDNRMPVTIWAKSDVQVLIIRKMDVIKLTKMEEQFLIHLLADMANKFTFISNKLAYLTFKSLEDRILFFLSQQTPDDEGFIHVKQKMTELSSLLGVERPSLSRALSRMARNGIIFRKNRMIKIVAMVQEQMERNAIDGYK